MLYQKSLSCWLARWSQKLQEFRLSFKHSKVSAECCTHMEQIFGQPWSIDLNSPHFESDDYLGLLAYKEATAGRLSVVVEKVYVRTTMICYALIGWSLQMILSIANHLMANFHEITAIYFVTLGPIWDPDFVCIFLKLRPGYE